MTVKVAELPAAATSLEGGVVMTGGKVLVAKTAQKNKLFGSEVGTVKEVMEPVAESD
jgi:hypothetical protein